MRKLWCLLAASMMAVTLTGCGTDLTNQETRVIAEYAADLLLKYDKNYQERLDEEISEDVVTETTEETAVTTEADSATEAEPDTTESTESTEEAASETEAAAPIESISDIAEVVGLEGISVQYNRCMFLDRYPSLDQDGMFIYLEADPGYKLVVLKFDIVNHTQESQMVNLLDADLDYQLVLNGTRAAKPMLTILMDDLGTYQAVVPAEEEQAAVLVFQMSEGLMDDIQSLNLKVTYQNQENMIQIQ